MASNNGPKGPGLFSDFGNKARDVLTRDYTTEHKLSLSSESATGVAILSSLSKRGGFSSGSVGVQHKYKNATTDVKIDTESNVVATVTVTDILPSTKTIVTGRFSDFNSGKMAATVTVADILPSTKTTITARYPDYNSGKLGVQYFHDHASFTTSIDLNKTPNVDISATVGTPYIAFGTEASYKVDSRSFTKYSAGFSLTKPYFGASLLLADKADAVKATFFRHLDQKKKCIAAAD